MEINKNKKKTIIFVIDKQSRRAVEFCSYLTDRGWSVKICSNSGLSDSFSPLDCLSETTISEATKFCLRWPNAAIHVFSPSCSTFALSILFRFRQRAIYDPVDVICGNQKAIGLSDFTQLTPFRKRRLKLMLRNAFFTKK